MVALLASVFTLLLISCDRFFGIVFVMKARLTERRSSLCILLVWLAAMTLACPILVYRRQFTRLWKDYSEIWCDDDWPPEVAINATGHVTISRNQGRVVYFTVVSGVLFFAPIVIMLVTHTSIICTLWGSQLPGESTEANKHVHKRLKRKVNIFIDWWIIQAVI